MKIAHIDLGKHPFLTCPDGDVTDRLSADMQEIRSRYGVHRICIE